MKLARSHLRILAVSALAFGALASPAAAKGGCAHANASVAEATSSRVLARSAVCLLNKERARRGLPGLRLNRRLSAAADNHTADMVRKRYFDHVSRTGRDVVDRLTHTGYLGRARSWTVGENIAWGSGSLSSPREIVQSWMHSPGHRANILSRRFREIGIGVVFAVPSHRWDGATYTTTFGAKR